MRIFTPEGLNPMLSLGRIPLTALIDSHRIGTNLEPHARRIVGRENPQENGHGNVIAAEADHRQGDA
jgi:hypothetical protein